MCSVNKYISITARKGLVHLKLPLEELGVTTGQYMYLIVLCEQEGLSQEHLAELVGINKSTTAKVISQLMEEGFVTREQDPEDKRGYKVYPTKKARAIYPKIIKLLKEWNEKLLDGISEDERDTLYRLLDKVEQNARAHCK